MSLGIRQKCAKKYIVLLRIYMGMLAVIALCAAIVLAADSLWAGVFVMLGVFAMLCMAAVTVPLRCGRIGYTRSGGCLRIERGLLVRRTLVVNRSDIRYSEICDGPLERRLGICTVTFYTGGGRVRLRGILSEDGQRLHYLFGGEAAG